MDFSVEECGKVTSALHSAVRCDGRVASGVLELLPTGLPQASRWVPPAQPVRFSSLQGWPRLPPAGVRVWCENPGKRPSAHTAVPRVRGRTALRGHRDGEGRLRCGPAGSV